MANAGTFVKGEKRPNQGKRGPDKATLMAREAIAKLVDGNADRLAGWLDEIADDEKQGPVVAWRCMMDVLEYHIPKLARTELTGEGGGAIRIIATTQDEAA
jgi:hypothetical protein